MKDVLVRAEGVSKKFSRSLRSSLWYGLRDLGSEVTGSRGKHDVLRDGEFWALNDIGFELSRGECLGLIGHNGAGKTTLLRILTGLIKPDRGMVQMRGRVSALIALGAGFNPILTGRENIYVNASILGFKKRQTDKMLDRIIDFSGIEEFIDSPVKNYSSGMTVRLGFSIAINTEPDILLLDEVLAVGDVAFQAKCFNALASFRERGTAFILVSHNMHQIARYSTKVLYLKRGEVAQAGAADEVIDRFVRESRGPHGVEDERGPQWGSAVGSGKIRLVSTAFLDQHGNAINRVDPSSPFSLEIEFERLAELGNPIILDVVIRDNEGTIYQGTNDASGQEFECSLAKGRFVVRFPSLPVNCDHALFFVAVMDRETKEIFDWRRNIRLDIETPRGQHGRLALGTEWLLMPPRLDGRPLSD